MPYTRAQLIAAFRAENPDAGHIEDNKIFAAIAQEDPDLAKGISELHPPTMSDNRSAGQVALDQTGNIIKGAASAITGLPGMVSEGAHLVGSAASGDVIGTLKRLRGMATGVAEGIAAPVTPILQTATSEMGLTPEPTRQQWEQGAQAAGANAMGLALPEAAGAVSRAATPEALMGLANKARAIRAANPSTLSTLAETSITKPLSIVKQGATAVGSAGAGIAAPILENLAQARAGAPIVQPPPVVDPVQAAIEADQAAGPVMSPSNPAVVAADEASRMRQVEPVREPVTPQQPLGIQRPDVPAHVQTDLAQMAQQTAQQQIPQLETVPPTGPPAPIEAPGLQEATSAIPEGDIAPFEIQMAQQAIAPSSMTEKLSTIRNIPDLLKEVPELRGTPPGKTFDTKLMNGFRRTEHNLAAAEESIPRETQVPIGDAVKQLKTLEQELSMTGQNKAVASVAKLQEKLSEFPNMIPWEQFRDLKRAFFKEVSPSSGTARQAYRILMDTSDQVSPALTEANRSYYIVRTALENAKIDRFTGVRIRSVGKPIKPVGYTEPSKTQFRMPL